MTEAERKVLVQQIAELDKEHAEHLAGQPIATGNPVEVMDEVQRRTTITMNYQKKRENLQRSLVESQEVASGVQSFLNPILLVESQDVTPAVKAFLKGNSLPGKSI